MKVVTEVVKRSDVISENYILRGRKMYPGNKTNKKKITRAFINKEVDKYLKAGGTITKFVEADIEDYEPFNDNPHVNFKRKRDETR